MHPLVLQEGRLALEHLLAVAGGNCIKIGLPGKLILSKRKGHILLKIVSENRFSGRTYFYTIGPCT